MQNAIFEPGRCPCWATPAKLFRPDVGQELLVDSLRTGGQYLITADAEAAIRTYDICWKPLLTSWLVEQRRAGTTVPKVTVEVLTTASQRKPLDVSARADRILEYLKIKTSILGTPVSYRVLTNIYFDINIEDVEKTYLELLITSESIADHDLGYLLAYLENRNWITHSGKNNRDRECTLSVEGYTRLAELERTFVTTSKAFMAMWFDESMGAAWEQGFEPAIRGAGYEPVRIDHKEHVNKIDDEIIAEIRRARFVVADFTHGVNGVRGGVYYEAGFAHGLGIPVIFSCRADVLEEIHFDTRQYNHIVWEHPSQLREALQKRIGAIIGDNPFTRRNGGR